MILSQIAAAITDICVELFFHRGDYIELKSSAHVLNTFALLTLSDINKEAADQNQHFVSEKLY